MTGRDSTKPTRGGESALPTSGLASEVLPQLREKMRRQATPETKSGEGRRAAPEPSANAALVDFADRLHAPEAAPAPPAPVRQLVTFWLGGAQYGLPIEVVKEILRVDVISPVPQAPPHIRGVTNLRGRVIPVVEISTRLGGAPIELTPQTCIVAVLYEGRVLGLLVERASNVMSLSEDAIEEPPADVLGESADYVTGVGKQDRDIVILLDLERLLKPDAS